MKKITSTLIFALLALISFAQDTTLVSGMYGNFQYTDKFNGNIYVSANSTVSITGTLSLPSSCTLEIKQGATLLLPNGLSTNITVKIDPGAYVLVTGNFTLAGGILNDAGSLQVTRTLSGGGQSIVMSGCGLITTSGLQFSNDNIVTGMGLIVVQGVYDNQGSSGWSGHPLTSSSGIFLNSNTTYNIGAAQKTSSTAGCGTVTPITLASFSAVYQNGNIYFTWTTEMESNVDHYEIWNVTDTGKNFKAVTLAASTPDGNSSSPHQYVYTIVGSEIVTAGFGGFIVIGILLGMVSKARKLMVAVPIAVVLLIVGVTSCSKKNTLYVPKTYHEVYQLREIDKDGTTHYMTNEVAVIVTQ